ncbi:Peroxidase 52 [Ranunculus cassubicifolius]
MASSINITVTFCIVFLSFACCTNHSAAQTPLSATFYDYSCPNLQSIVRRAMIRAVNSELRMGASILRLFFHDCFVLGCDASILLNDTATFVGEKTAFPNRNSVRGYDVIDTIKDLVEAECHEKVSCADILALAARDAVDLLGGPEWTVLLGRRDSTTASLSAANSELPSPFADLSTLISSFAAKGLDARDMTALSGAHTIGYARCLTFRGRIYNDTNIDAGFARFRQRDCPPTGEDDKLAPLDFGSTNFFNNHYYDNLVEMRGLLHSDQELFNNGAQDNLVRSYKDSNSLFERDFAYAMVKMGNINPLTGSNGEIRKKCWKLN